MAIEDFRQPDDRRETSPSERPIKDEDARKARSTEYRTAANLVERGFSVSHPSEQSPFDLIAFGKRDVYRLEVKHTEYEKNKGSYLVDVSLGHNGTLPVKSYKDYHDFVVVRTPDSWFIIPSDRLDNNRTFTIGEGNKWGEFKDNWSLSE